MDDSGNLDPWLYTATFTGRGGAHGDARAFAVELFDWLVSDDSEDLSPEKIHSENTRVRRWMERHPEGIMFCFELDAIHEDLDWLLSELGADVEHRYRERPDQMRSAVVYHIHNYHYRVHAYREKVAQLLNACLDLRRSNRELNAERVLEDIGNKPEYRTIHDLLSGLMNERAVSEIIGRRNLIAHRALLEYKSGSGTWQVVTAERRAQDYFAVTGVSEEAQLFVNLDDFLRHNSQRLREVTSILSRFRVRLTRALRQLALTSSA